MVFSLRVEILLRESRESCVANGDCASCLEGNSKLLPLDKSPSGPTFPLLLSIMPSREVV